MASMNGLISVAPKAQFRPMLGHRGDGELVVVVQTECCSVEVTHTHHSGLL